MRAAEWADAVKKAIGEVIYGKDGVIEQLLVALLCQGPGAGRRNRADPRLG